MGRNGKVDIRNLENFQKELQKSLSGKELDLFIESCAKAIARRLLEKVIPRTPVGVKPKLEGKKTYKVKGASGKSRSFLTADAARIQQYWSGYHGGTLRRGWTNGKDVKAEEFAESLNIHRSSGMYKITIVNNVEYASYVEWGHRQTPGRYVPALGKRLKQGWVKGKKMLTISEDEVRREAPKALENKLKKKLGEIFK